MNFIQRIEWRLYKEIKEKKIEKYYSNYHSIKLQWGIYIL